MANGSLRRWCGICCLAAAVVLAAPPAAAQCRLCPKPAPGKAPPTTAITIEVTAGIDFSRIGLVTANQGGAATLDPVTGQRTLTGSLVPLSGLPVQGSVTIRGAKNEQVAVTLPSSATLSTPTGGTIQLTALTSDLKGSPKLDKDGLLSFNFGGRLLIDGRSHGDFRGTIPITVEYR